MKWEHVKALVLHGSGPEAQRVRRALERQVIVVTDPMALARAVDMRLVERGRSLPLIGGVLVGKVRSAGPLLKIEQQVREWVTYDLLATTGVGTIESLISQSDNLGMSADRGVHTRRVADEIRGSISKATKLASRSMMLVMHERDPERRGRPDVGRWAGVMRFGNPETMLAHARLNEIAKAKIFFDKGEEDVTRVVDRLRKDAERVVAYSPLEDPNVRGFALDEDDANMLRLQVADIAVGYARAIMEQPRFAHVALAELVQRFRLILYNGSQLTPEEATQADLLRIHHRHALQRAFGAA